MESMTSHEPELDEQFKIPFAKRALGLRASEIRELLKLTAKPGIISFAGGLPNPDYFPYETISDICRDVVMDLGRSSLQYGSTEGYTPLREAIAGRLKRTGVDLDGSDILVTSGSQQGLDLISKIFIQGGDHVVSEAPMYLGAASTFSVFRANIHTVPLDDEGIMVDLVEEKLKSLNAEDYEPKFIYVDPTFHNPAGVTLSESRRRKLLDLAHDFDTLIVEDDPYGELRYSGDPVKPIKAFDDEGRVIYLGTFSKLLCPGFRIAWMTAEPRIYQKLVFAKQSTDLCTNTFGQVVTHEFIARGHLEGHIETIKDAYHRKRDIMLEALDEYFPDGCQWTRPDGGLFLWATLPDGIDTRDMFPRAIENNVAYVISHCFYPDRSGTNGMRLNFSYSTDEEIVEGIKRLAAVIEGEIKDQGV